MGDRTTNHRPIDKAARYARLAEYEPFRHWSYSEVEHLVFADLYWQDNPLFENLAKNYLRDQFKLTEQIVSDQAELANAWQVMVNELRQIDHPVAVKALRKHDELKATLGVKAIGRRLRRHSEPLQKVTASIYNYRRLNGTWPENYDQVGAQLRSDWGVMWLEEANWIWEAENDWQWAFGGIYAPTPTPQIFVLPEFIDHYSLEAHFEARHGGLAS